MRFSLTFILHQMEVYNVQCRMCIRTLSSHLTCITLGDIFLVCHQVTLQESFSKLLEGDEEEGGGGEKREGEGGSEVRDLRSTLAQLRKRLRQTEDTHKVELQESKVETGLLYYTAGRPTLKVSIPL